MTEIKALLKVRLIFKRACLFYRFNIFLDADFLKRCVIK